MEGRSLITFRFALALVLFLSIVTPVHSEKNDDDLFSSGTNFYEGCAVLEKLGPDDNPTHAELRNAGECIGFLAGVVLAVGGTEGVHNIDESDGVMCLPENSTRIQEFRIVKKYISDHPEKAHLSAVVQVINALHEAFPCKRLFRVSPKSH
jgi:hypothetical protein